MLASAGMPFVAVAAPHLAAIDHTAESGFGRALLIAGLESYMRGRQ